MYELNNKYIIEETLYMLTKISDEDFKKIERFCMVSEGRAMKFYDFIKALADIREHQITDESILLPVAAQMLMIQDMVDGIKPVCLSVMGEA